MRKRKKNQATKTKKQNKKKTMGKKQIVRNQGQRWESNKETK